MKSVKLPSLKVVRLKRVRAQSLNLSLGALVYQGPVVRTPVSANPGLSFNPGCFIFLSKALSRIIFSFLFGVSNYQIVGKEN